MRSPAILHQPFPISQITPNTIVLGSSFIDERRPSSDSQGKDDESDGTVEDSPTNVTAMSSEYPIEASASVPPERCTSPRRDNSAIERIGREKVHVLRKEAQLMQESLTDILDRIVQVKQDYDRLSSENRFLQDYIGNLMATSNILGKR
uniref:ARAD1D02640p n=1 Tax=Blastobotrys adeninivorans TaxID=409370 RepID=A0A060T7W1_BLAAD